MCRFTQSSHELELEFCKGKEMTVDLPAQHFLLRFDSILGDARYLTSVQELSTAAKNPNGVTYPLIVHLVPTRRPASESGEKTSAVASSTIIDAETTYFTFCKTEKDLGLELRLVKQTISVSCFNKVVLNSP